MARKRKLESKSAEPAKKQQQSINLEQVVREETQPEPEEDVEDQGNEEEAEYEEVEEEVEEEEEEEDEEGEEEEDDDEEEEEDDNDDPDNIQNGNDQTAKAPSTSRSVTDQDGKGDDDEEPIQKLLEPFSKEQIVNLLLEAADKHRDVADRIREVADEDPVHRKIFVHGLGWDTNTETLNNAFKQYGEIEESKAVYDKASGKSKGYGFILFKTRSGARKALKQPQKKIGNRMTSCQLASIGPVAPPSAAQAVPQQLAFPPQQPASEYTQRKIYVSNVGADLDTQKLLTFFSSYGEIEEGPLGLDKATGRPKGFCLFVYRTADSARKALEEPHKNFDGHILHCQKAIDGPKPGKSQYQHHQNPRNTQFQRNNSANFSSEAATGHGHLMAPAGPGIAFNQGAAAAQALNPALGQALTALLASQGAGLGLTNLLGTLGSAATVNTGVPGASHGIQGGYGNQPNITPGVIGGYGNQGGIQGGYPSQQIGQSGSGRGQPGVGQYGGVPPYMGH